MTSYDITPVITCNTLYHLQALGVTTFPGIFKSNRGHA